MAAKNHSWTIDDTGCGNGPSGEDDMKPSGYIAFQPTLEGGTLSGAPGARDAVPYEYDFHKLTDINPAPARVDVNPSLPDGYGVPAPFAGDKGQPIDFNAVAPEKDGQDYDLDGSGAPAAGSFVFDKEGGLA